MPISHKRDNFFSSISSICEHYSSVFKLCQIIFYKKFAFRTFALYNNRKGDIVMNLRFKEIRNSLGLTQAEFGKKINLKKPTISELENGKRSLSDRVISDVCREFSISEEWLKYGTGEMFVKRSPALSQFEQIIEDFDLEDLVKVREFMDMLIKVKEGSKIIQIRDHIEYISRPLYDLPAHSVSGYPVIAWNQNSMIRMLFLLNRCL
jgi:transcriptional regulator with XRE-family HTH domain